MILQSFFITKSRIEIAVDKSNGDKFLLKKSISEGFGNSHTIDYYYVLEGRIYKANRLKEILDTKFINMSMIITGAVDSIHESVLKKINGEEEKEIGDLEIKAEYLKLIK